MRQPGDYWVVIQIGKGRTETVATYNGTNWKVPGEKDRKPDEYFKEIENQPIKQIKTNL